MNNNLQKGKLKRWRDDRGFGFIASGEGGRDIFIHISALKQMGRRPRIGDVIIYQIHTDDDGKTRAVNAKIEGVSEFKARPAREYTKRQSKSGWISKALPVALVILLGTIAYTDFAARNEIHEKPTAAMFSFALEQENTNNFSCSGKMYCSEMTSCDEAMYYQRNCPGTKMDGDRDGIPCERQWCNW